MLSSVNYCKSMRRLKQIGIIGVHGICTTITAEFVHGVFIGCLFLKNANFGNSFMKIRFLL